MVLHQGDLDYEDKPSEWIAQIDNVLGPTFPYFVSVGNHDCTDGYDCNGPSKWPDYQALLEERTAAIEGVTCAGKLGWLSACSYKGLFFTFASTPSIVLATSRGPTVDFFRDQLANSTSRWRVCSFHKPHPLISDPTSDYANVGWELFETCRNAGAIVATAHIHTYARTHQVNNFETQSTTAEASPIAIGSGSTVAFISGLGGHSVHDVAPDAVAHPIWAVAPGGIANFGALFCTFNVGGVANQGSCYFKDVNGVVHDAFDIESRV